MCYYIADTLQRNWPALAAIEETRKTSGRTLSRTGFRAISSVLNVSPHLAGQTYGLLVEKAIINQIPEETLPSIMVVQYGGHSPVRYTDVPEVPTNRYVPVPVKKNMDEKGVRPKNYCKLFRTMPTGR
jgi:hypothetical protein